MSAVALRETTRLSHFRHVVTDSPVTLVAAALYVLIVVVALFGPWLAPFDPMASDTSQALVPPSRLHPFGTDSLGRDLLSRCIVAARLDLALAVSAVALSFVIGATLGAAAGFFGGWFDRIVSRLAGNSEWSVLMRHVFPNLLPPMAVQVSLNMGWAMLNAAGLSFIGLGVRPPTPEWGIMVAEGAQYIVSGEWWVALFPGACLMLAVFAFNLLGDALRDLLDPRMRT